MHATGVALVTRKRLASRWRASSTARSWSRHSLPNVAKIGSTLRYVAAHGRVEVALRLVGEVLVVHEVDGDDDGVSSTMRA